MSSETWKNIQEHKRKQESLRERIQKRRKLVGVNSEIKDSDSIPVDANKCNKVDSASLDATPLNPNIEKLLQQYLCSNSLVLPISSKAIYDGMQLPLQDYRLPKDSISIDQVELLLQKQAAQQFLTVKNLSDVEKSDKQSTLEVTSIENDKLAAVSVLLKQKSDSSSSSPASNIKNKKKPTINEYSMSKSERSSHKRSEHSHEKRDSSRSKVKKTEKSKDVSDDIDDIQALLSTKTAKEQDTTRIADEIQELLSVASTKELTLAEKFRSLGGSQVREFCPYATREECLKHNRSYSSCQKLHFRKILKPHTDEALGDCSFLNTCFHMDTCKYVHYEIDYRGTDLDPRKNRKSGRRKDLDDGGKALIPKFASDEDYLNRKMLPPQWINCDIRYIDISVLGKFSVIMADPPWDIHMELPYGTMQDTEMRNLRIQDLSDDGLIFLWVTGRAMELGRELFDCWGYKRCDELIWVKTNQLQRLIRTGRTGHWINHGKEHCLVGIKGNPSGINRRLDCDVLVAEVRATSHKPDEIYGIIERLSPGTRKLELFGRMHNIQPNWITLGNQLDGVHLVEYDVVEKFRSKYPDGQVTKPKPLLEAPPEINQF